jgi:hypothetical protein
MPNDGDDLKNQTEEPFSLKENFRQRSYYEKYYEDLAAHANKMEEKGQHEIAEADRAEMQHVSKVLDDLVKEKFEKYDKQQPENQQTTQQNNQERDAAKSELNTGHLKIPDQSKQIENHQDIIQEETIQQEQLDQSQVEDIPQEDLIPADKSHFTDEALEAHNRADKQLAATEAAIDQKIKVLEAETEQGESMDRGTDLSPEENKPSINSEELSGSDVSDKSIQTEQDQSYDYGYGY